MKTFQLNAEPRTDLGKKAAKALRKENKIPVVLNGGKLVELKDGKYDGKLLEGEKVVPVGRDGKAIITTDLWVNAADVRKLIYTPEIYVIDLTFDGQTKKAVLKDIQFHAVSDAIMHIDLLEVYEDKPVTMEVPVHVEGHAVGVKAGGKLYLSMKKVKVRGLYSKMPETIMVDVSNLQIGHAIKVRDLQFDDYELVSAKELVICGVKATRASANAAATEGDEEAAE
ncbi:MAG: 50S ribosomal protein L25 [Muribaculaceae bacterium]|nr:50S ribosomal protein L25 [Muribaculaceae bacterium]MBR1727512.1 50S ribosomal protein L25 [Muribaculaceae bacterium]